MWQDGNVVICFFFQAEDGIRDAQESRGLGDVYKRQPQARAAALMAPAEVPVMMGKGFGSSMAPHSLRTLSLIHI